MDIEAQLAAERAERAVQDRRVAQLIQIVARMGHHCGVSVDDLLAEPTPSPTPQPSQPQHQLHLGTPVSNMVHVISIPVLFGLSHDQSPTSCSLSPWVLITRTSSSLVQAILHRRRGQRGRTK